MTLEVSVSEVIVVGDVFGVIRQFIARIISLFGTDGEEDTSADNTNSDNNKAPPESDGPILPDLGVQVRDNAKPGESFGP